MGLCITQFNRIFIDGRLCTCTITKCFFLNIDTEIAHKIFYFQQLRVEEGHHMAEQLYFYIFCFLVFSVFLMML